MVTVLVEPRVMHVPATVDSLAPRAVEWCAAHGLGLDPEQELALGESLGVRADGRWRSFEVGVNAPRQNGKGEILMARELFGAYELGEMSIVHSAHEFKTSERHFRRLESAIRADKELLSQVKRSATGRVVGFRYSHGDEAIELESGAMIEFRTRTRSGMRGFDDVALLVLDEAMILSEAAHSAMLPTVRASTAERGPQLWYAGSAADQDVHENSVVWARVRERGIAGEDPGLSYFEWSLDFARPEDVPDEVAADPEWWRRVNWAIERGRVSEEHMQREFRSLGRRGFVVELLGVGDYPRTDGSPHQVISLERWRQLAEAESEIDGSFAFAFDVTPDRSRSCITAAGKRSDGSWHVEVVDHKRGTGWVVPRLAELQRKHAPIAVLYDRIGPAASLSGDLEEADVPAETVSSSEYAQACGRFVDHVEQGTLRHLGTDELDAAVRGAGTRPLGDAWAWSRKSSSADISPLVSATLAMWAIGGDRPSVYRDRGLVVL